MIREASQSDVPVLAALIRGAFAGVAERFRLSLENCPKHPSNCMPEWIESALAKNVRYAILESEGAPCGCVAVERASGEVCYMERLAVLPVFRRRGFGRKLVDHALFLAKSMGADRLEIGIISEDVELKEWYRRIGFVETRTARFEHLPFEVAFMAKKLE